MASSGFIAFTYPSIELAAWAANSRGWTAKASMPDRVLGISPASRAVELTHPAAPFPVLVVQECEDGGPSLAGMLQVDLPIGESFQLPALLRRPVIASLLDALAHAAAVARPHCVGV